MKIYVFFLICCAFVTRVNGQQEMSFDTTILVGKERYIYEYRTITIDRNNNKYVAGLFKDSTVVDTIHLATILHNSNEVTKAIFISKYDSTGKLLSSKKLVESDSCSSFSITMDNSNNLYIAEYCDEIQPDV
ncbi:MAG TPA: hypothetical protein PLU10_10065, partial [Chitinophagaceae bacterium]|nr:hypothetical protein [Chitinophagaceae bacterium]